MGGKKERRGREGCTDKMEGRKGRDKDGAGFTDGRMDGQTDGQMDG